MDPGESEDCPGEHFRECQPQLRAAMEASLADATLDWASVVRSAGSPTRAREKNGLDRSAFRALCSEWHQSV